MADDYPGGHAFNRGDLGIFPISEPVYAPDAIWSHYTFCPEPIRKAIGIPQFLWACVVRLGSPGNYVTYPGLRGSVLCGNRTGCNGHAANSGSP